MVTNTNTNSLIINGKEWKVDVKMRKSDKETFIQILFNKSLQYLEHKANLVGIEVIYQEESYTSKADTLKLDEIPTYKKDKKDSYQFSGKRVKRGLYKSAKGALLNSDVNGAISYNINILRKRKVI
jgi:IS605 OrfB family transposase